MASQQFAVRVEAVNIYDTILDNDQLSVVRGGGLLLRDAILRLDEWARRQPDWHGWEKITVGASIGEFRLEAGADTEPQIEERIAAWLSADEYYRFLTFAVSVIASGDSAAASVTREQLLAALRWNQQMQPRIAFEPDDHDVAEPCGITRIRPAQYGARIGDKPCSASVAKRFEAGRAAKGGGRPTVRLADFYFTETQPRFHARLRQLGFAVDMADIAEDPARGTLHNKVAVFYADGNRFSRIVAAANTQPDLQTGGAKRLSALSALDQDIQYKRRELLTRLLEWADTMPGMHLGRDGPGLRLEVLLWGGDELILVVPAWAGFSLLEKFFEFTADWKPALRDGDSVLADASTRLREGLMQGDKHALTVDGQMTHAVGLVFANAKTPLYLTRRLANELADAAKDRLKQEVHNVYQVLALESVDYPGEALDDFQRKRLPGALGDQSRTFFAPMPRETVGAPDALSELRTALTDVSRAQVHALVEVMIRKADAPLVQAAEPAPEAKKDARRKLADPVLQQRARLQEMLQDSPAGIDAAALAGALARVFSPLTAAIPETGAAVGIDTIPDLTWIQLRELWDYLAADPAQAPDARKPEAAA